MKNWAGNVEYSTHDVRHPTTPAEVAEIVAAVDAADGQLKALGSRHSFSLIADTAGTLVALDELVVEPTLQLGDDGVAVSVRVGAGSTYAQVGAFLAANDLALPNLASLPHISVAGAVQTGTHGSGVRNGSLASSVLALEIVRASGQLEIVREHDPDFAASVVGLGALGIVTAVTLRVQPHFEVAQHVHEGLPWAAALSNWSAIMSGGYSVSVFTTFQGENTHQIWSKRRPDVDGPEVDLVALGATEASVTVHPLPGVAADSVTAQLREPGPWNERLAHFRSEFQPSHGEEIQSEYLIPAEHAVAAITALRAIGDRIAPLLHVSELRSVAADTAWLSPSYARDSLAIHFTWKPLPEAILAVLPLIEHTLEPFAPRPHWGKVATMSPAGLARAYPRLGDFAAHVRRVDPAGRFMNPYLKRVLPHD
ncbi:FAD-binding protein [Cryobacterium sp. 1639]|uniref:D-arabinono-1,4-lactone oxidase n=1 Tax=Cryobacterium inferilacus TaxID=2866629 RepID=UPI001C72D809|nr:D-arabinono-1,4-lactone oxidase [Cryobacterium sp. 1639]MBX0300079.1 FAD-binding protein [Cryobacterium sp. 1639]